MEGEVWLFCELFNNTDAANGFSVVVIIIVFQSGGEGVLVVSRYSFEYKYKSLSDADDVDGGGAVAVAVVNRSGYKHVSVSMLADNCSSHDCKVSRSFGLSTGGIHSFD